MDHWDMNSMNFDSNLKPSTFAVFLYTLKSSKYHYKCHYFGLMAVINCLHKISPHRMFLKSSYSTLKSTNLARYLIIFPRNMKNAQKLTYLQLVPIHIRHFPFHQPEPPQSTIITHKHKSGSIGTRKSHRLASSGGSSGFSMGVNCPFILKLSQILSAKRFPSSGPQSEAIQGKILVKFLKYWSY